MQDTLLMQRVFTLIEVFRDLLSANPYLEKVYDSFPRNVEHLILYGLEIPAIRVPNLTIRAATQYLCALRGEATQQNGEIDDRDLFGLLHVGPPCNIIFVRDDLPEHIRNYILAHELGHFLADVFIIRQLWLKTFPQQKDAIQRIFSWQESDPRLELYALFKGLPVRPKTIVGRGQAITQETIEREILADLFAVELLAPREIISPLFNQNNRQQFVALLREQYGLPFSIVAYYCEELQHSLTPQTDILDKLFSHCFNPHLAANKAR